MRGQRFLKPPQLTQRVAHVGPGAAIVRLERQSPFIIGNCRMVQTESPQCHSGIVEQVRIGLIVQCATTIAVEGLNKPSGMVKPQSLFKQGFQLGDIHQNPLARIPWQNPLAETFPAEPFPVETFSIRNFPGQKHPESRPCNRERLYPRNIRRAR